ncbi:MAG: hypothetical protein PF904_06960 [Kiritimatiellae bacterium]|nr:hypothetical protein [Kiritimatiellia bacterium]
MQNRRMFVHDYSRVGFYMITISTAPRRRLFGACRNNRVELSEAGVVVSRRWHEISLHCPSIEASTLQIMPDHLHGILYVKEQLPKPVGEIVRGFKSGVTAELRRNTGNPSLSVWETGFHDRVIMNSDTLRAERHYIFDNPRRYCVKRAHPDLFVRVNDLDNTRLPKRECWTGFGNLFLIDKPELLSVQVSRRATIGEISDLKAAVVARIKTGAVMVSPFISPGEKEIVQLIIKQAGGNLILIKSGGFSPLYKPSGVYFDLCAQGRLLVLSPFVYSDRKQPFTRELCLQMNRWVGTICGNKAVGY